MAFGPLTLPDGDFSPESVRRAVEQRVSPTPIRMPAGDVHNAAPPTAAPSMKKPASAPPEAAEASSLPPRRYRRRLGGDVPPTPPLPLDLGGGKPVSAPCFGECWLIRSTGADSSALAAATKATRAAPNALRQAVRRALPNELAIDVACPLDSLIAMDIETTGLGNVPLFLIGHLVWEAGEWVVYQHLARRVAEEAAVVAAYTQACHERQVLITFNGANFDVPFVHRRARQLRVPPPPALPHLDLLPICRKVWGEASSDCRLTTLETRLLERRRQDDVPSSDIPRVYADALRHGNTTALRQVLRHNVLDLASMADLLVLLGRKTC